MWEETKLEKFTREKLPVRIGDTEAATIWANYETARSAVVDSVLPDIAAFEPNLSDHGPRHIKDVMENIWLLLADEKNCPVETFVLCVSALYHDVGNIFGRQGHQKRMVKIFNDTFPSTSIHRNKIRTLIMNIAGAHTGVAHDGTKDTLKFLEPDNLFKVDVNARELGAVLRLADELAEGPHRTSFFRIKNDLYDEISKKFHIYASCCSPPHLIKKRNQIALKYTISIIKNETSELTTLNGDVPLDTLLEFIFGRAIKLDQERKYCRHYSQLYLSEYRETSVAFEFWLNDEDRIEFSKPPLILNDLIIPGAETKNIEEHYPEYKVVSLIDDLKSLIG